MKKVTDELISEFNGSCNRGLEIEIELTTRRFKMLETFEKVCSGFDELSDEKKKEVTNPIVEYCKFVEDELQKIVFEAQDVQCKLRENVRNGHNYYMD